MRVIRNFDQQNYSFKDTKKNVFTAPFRVVLIEIRERL